MAQTESGPPVSECVGLSPRSPVSQAPRPAEALSSYRAITTPSPQGSKKKTNRNRERWLVLQLHNQSQIISFSLQVLESNDSF